MYKGTTGEESMSVSCNILIGYTVTLKNSLNSEDFDFFNDFIENNPEYNQFNSKNTVQLVIDGMSGNYARLVYVDHKERDCYPESCVDYIPLRLSPVPDDIYDKLNTAYTKLYDKPLGRDSIQYGICFCYG